MERFIELIKQMPCLWDMESREYRDMRKKHSAWKRIVEELHIKEIPDIATAKAEWKKLRDSHRDSLKRTNALGPLGHNQDSALVNKWKYAEQMEFLLPYMKTRKRRWNTVDSSDDSSTSPSDSFVATPITSHTNMCLSPESDFQKVDTTEQIEQTFSKRQKMENELSEIMIDMDEKPRCLDHNHHHNHHPLDSFFKSMCETTKQFPTWLQFSIKRKIFNLISEAEDTFESCKSREQIF